MITTECGNPPIELSNPLDLASHPEYPPRQWVPVELRPWNTPMKAYNPPEYTHPKVQKLMAQDPSLDWKTMSASAKEKLVALNAYVIDPEKGPRNPLGRTGLEGAGKWRRPGPNIAADLQKIVLCGEDYYALNVVRKDNKNMVAWPGGMVDLTDLPGLDDYSDLYDLEVRKQAAINAGIREAGEETNINTDILNELRPEIKFVYSGPTGGPRGTDSRWAETVASAVLVEVDELPHIEAGDDAYHAIWTPISQELYASDHRRLMHANHGQTLRLAMGVLGIAEQIPKLWSDRHLQYLYQALPEETGAHFNAVVGAGR